VGCPGYEMWVAEVAGEEVGYLELAGGPEGDVEVAYLGILTGFTGMGLGGALLTAGVGRAWRRGAGRVWVHTCSLDGPHARANYLARGFRPYDFVVRRTGLPTSRSSAPGSG
jgi:GNAT superfamily N-acetyltransferase